MTSSSKEEERRRRYDRLVAVFYQDMYRYAAWLSRDKAIAEDVVQETFLCAFRWLASYNSQYSFRTWLWTILLNQCRRHYKRGARRQSEVAWDAPEVAIDEGAARCTSDAELPLAQLVGSVFVDRFRRIGRIKHLFD